MRSIKFADILEENQFLRMEINEAIQKVISSGDFINGIAVSQFENSLAEYLDVKHVIGVGNGTDALQIALIALGIHKGDEVILPSFTYFATAEAVAFLGIIPVFVDINLDTFNINPIDVKNAITEKTKAILPVHFYGNPCDMTAILQIAKESGLFVIEDAAQSIGASSTTNGIEKKISTFGDIGCFSFYPAKNLGAFGDAGALVTNNSYLAKRIRKLSNHGQSERYVHDLVGMNSRLDSIQAAILNVKLKYLSNNNQKRNELAAFYNEGLSDCNGVTTPNASNNSTHVYHQYTIKVAKEKRRVLQKHLLNRGIPTRLYYPIPVHKQKALKGKIKIPFELKNTMEVQETMLSLPIHPFLKRSDQKIIIQEILEFLINE